MIVGLGSEGGWYVGSEPKVVSASEQPTEHHLVEVPGPRQSLVQLLLPMLE